MKPREPTKATAHASCTRRSIECATPIKYIGTTFLCPTGINALINPDGGQQLSAGKPPVPQNPDGDQHFRRVNRPGWQVNRMYPNFLDTVEFWLRF
ncbi:hypothetical protein BHM03_00006362 [Ensete ventricosum]|nr:hypothetical protein BHM03_00006362 [Ensete ventricosum]